MNTGLDGNPERTQTTGRSNREIDVPRLGMEIDGRLSVGYKPLYNEEFSCILINSYASIVNTQPTEAKKASIITITTKDMLRNIMKRFKQSVSGVIESVKCNGTELLRNLRHFRNVDEFFEE
jgi:hypothetical protein